MTEAQPLYAKVKDHILAQIRNGVWEPGARVPSENQLVESFSVSRMTANRALRAAMRARLEIPVRFPPPALCTDNAAMIGAAAHFHFMRGRRDSLDLDVTPSLQLV